MIYQVRKMGGEADPRWAEAINKFWKQEIDFPVALGPPLPQTYFRSRTEIAVWAYQQYLDAFAVGGMPNLIAVIPKKFQGKGLFGTWEATVWEPYQVAVASEMNWPSLKFSLIHEFGHLFGLPDHFWPPTCIMAQIPGWLIPLKLRNVCPRCRELLKEV